MAQERHLSIGCACGCLQHVPMHMAAIACQEAYVAAFNIST